MGSHLEPERRLSWGWARSEQRSLGALGRMGVVVGMHAALLFVLVRGMGVTIPLPEAPDASKRRLIDQAPPVDPPPSTVDPPRTETPIWVPEPDHPPVEQDDQIQEKLITDTQTPADPNTGAGSALPRPQIARCADRRSSPVERSRPIRRRAFASTTKARWTWRSTSCRTGASATRASSRAVASRTSTALPRGSAAQLAHAAGHARRRAIRAVVRAARGVQAEERAQ